MNKCHLCQSGSVTELLDLGMQPICNRFLACPVDEEYTHSMVIGQCNACGLIQISNPMPAAELMPRYDWISYNEPEGHLNQLAEIIGNLSGITRESTICGISFKDDSILMRMNERGFEYTWRVDPEADLGINDHQAGIETIQESFTPGAVKAIAHKYGKADVIIARHILEHAHDMLNFMIALKHLLNPHGYLVIEVPDCSRALEEQDYSTLWEEHIVYFTPDTFRSSFAFIGLSLIRFECFPYPFESSLVGIAQSEEKIVPSFPSESILERERNRALAFSEGLIEHRNRLKRFFPEFRKNQGNIALFGAGHLACTFINLLELKDYIEFVADDSPNKRGLFMPGSHLPILGSDALLERGIKLCLLSLSPESEEKVSKNNQAFIDQGGMFSSIFPVSKHALKMEQFPRGSNYEHKAD